MSHPKILVHATYLGKRLSMPFQIHNIGELRDITTDAMSFYTIDVVLVD